MPVNSARPPRHLLNVPLILLAAALLLIPSSPAAGQVTSIEINGESGTGDATQGELGSDAGWRMIGPPVTSVTAGDLESPADGNGSVIEFDLPSNSGMFYGYDDGSDSFSEISDPSASLTNGRGYILFLFDDSFNDGNTQDDDADPLDPDLTLEFNTGSVPSTGSDVTVGGFDTGASFHLIANPYNTGFRFK